MFFIRLSLGLAFSLIIFTERVWAANVVCSTIGGKARFLTAPHNSCVCVSPGNQNLPGADCLTSPNSQPGCTASCGLDCYEGSGGLCYNDCNPGYISEGGFCVPPTCNTGSPCTVDTNDPAFKFAYPMCQPGGTGCDYGCTKGQKGCAGRPGCFSSCLGGTGIPQTKRKRDALNAARERLKRVADAVASGPLPSGGGIFSDKDICPILGHMACAVPGATTRDAFECIDPKVDLTSCGGCTAYGGLGVDCSKLEGVQGVQCVKGTCKIGSCKPRFRLTRGFDGQATCIRD